MREQAAHMVRIAHMNVRYVRTFTYLLCNYIP